MLTSGSAMSSTRRDPPHQDAEHHADDGGERKAREQPQDGVEGVVRQDAVGGEPDEGLGDSDERRDSFGGNIPARATISQSPSTTTNGNTLRAITRQRAFSLDAVRGRVSTAISAMGEHRAIFGRPTSDMPPHIYLCAALSPRVPGTAQHEAQREWCAVDPGPRFLLLTAANRGPGSAIARRRRA